MANQVKDDAITNEKLYDLKVPAKKKKAVSLANMPSRSFNGVKTKANG